MPVQIDSTGKSTSTAKPANRSKNAAIRRHERLLEPHEITELREPLGLSRAVLARPPISRPLAGRSMIDYIIRYVEVNWIDSNN